MKSGVIIVGLAGALLCTHACRPKIGQGGSLAPEPLDHGIRRVTIQPRRCHGRRCRYGTILTLMRDGRYVRNTADTGRFPYQVVSRGRIPPDLVGRVFTALSMHSPQKGPDRAPDLVMVETRRGKRAARVGALRHLSVLREAVDREEAAYRPAWQLMKGTAVQGIGILVRKDTHPHAVHLSTVFEVVLFQDGRWTCRKHDPSWKRTPAVFWDSAVFRHARGKVPEEKARRLFSRLRKGFSRPGRRCFGSRRTIRYRPSWFTPDMLKEDLTFAIAAYLLAPDGPYCLRWAPALRRTLESWQAIASHLGPECALPFWPDAEIRCVPAACAQERIRAPRNADPPHRSALF